MIWPAGWGPAQYAGVLLRVPLQPNGAPGRLGPLPRQDEDTSLRYQVAPLTSLATVMNAMANLGERAPQWVFADIAAFGERVYVGVRIQGIAPNYPLNVFEWEREWKKERYSLRDAPQGFVLLAGAADSISALSTFGEPIPLYGRPKSQPPATSPAASQPTADPPVLPIVLVIDKMHDPRRVLRLEVATPRLLKLIRPDGTRSSVEDDPEVRQIADAVRRLLAEAEADRER